MIGGWFIGDVGKTGFYFYKHMPQPFKFGGLFACTIDCMVLIQYFMYPQIESTSEYDISKDYYSGEITKEEAKLPKKPASL